MIHINKAHKQVVIPYREDVARLFPHARDFTFKSKRMLTLPHGLDETRMLQNLGLDVPAPILSQYDWPGDRKPFEAQRQTAALLTQNYRAYVLNGLGTGKTKSALWAWDYLYRAGLAKKLLVVAPLSTLNFTWASEIFKTLPQYKVTVLHGSREKRLKLLNEPGTDIFVINHDGVKVLAEELLGGKRGIDTIVLDELATYRNGQSARNKLMVKIAATMRWAWGMTGSPTPNSPADAWGQARILTPHTVPRFFTHFRDQIMLKVTQFKYVPKDDALDTVLKVMQPAVRYTLDDILELPECVEQEVLIAMGARQSRIYSEMKTAAFTRINNRSITAVNAGVVLTKLLQISTGWVYTKDKVVVQLDNEARLTALSDALAATDRKVIVFVPFVHALEGIKKYLLDQHIDVETVSGATPRAERERLFRLFQNTEKVKVLVAHPQCMAHGVTLTAADTVIWFAPTSSLEHFEQANGRIRRIGQTHKQLILMFAASEIERKTYTRLRRKQKVQTLLLDMFAENTGGI